MIQHSLSGPLPGAKPHPKGHPAEIQLITKLKICQVSGHLWGNISFQLVASGCLSVPFIAAEPLRQLFPKLSHPSEYLLNMKVIKPQPKPSQIKISLMGPRSSSENRFRAECMDAC